MPEQEHKPMDQESLPGPEQLGDSLLQSDTGAAQISPLMIVPVVIIAAVMALLLALVYGVTKEPIEQAKIKELADKLAVVMPDPDNDPATPPFDNDPGSAVQHLGEDIKLYTGTIDGVVTGFALTSAAPKSYSGGFSVIFGITPDGKINKVRILTTKETPGLGTKADPFVVNQLEGVDPATFKIDVTKDGGEVDAISGATITSRAVCQAVTIGLQAFNEAGGIAATEVPADAAVTPEPIDQPVAEQAPEAGASATGEPVTEPEAGDSVEAAADAAAAPPVTETDAVEPAEPEEPVTDPPATAAGEEGADGN